MISEIQNSLLRRGMNLEHRRLLLAISGGLDSMVLLHVFAQDFQKTKRLSVSQLEVCHVHHHLRGQDADQDAELVKTACKQLHIPFHLIHLDPKTLQRSGGSGLEAQARTARYEALQQLRQQQNLDLIVTAHHQDDQLETLLLRMLRGTGIAGLVGIKFLREDGILRPLLDCSRQQLLNYGLSQHIIWREDASNQSRRFRRNQVRHDLWPSLQKNHPQIAPQLLRINTLAHRVCQRYHLEPSRWGILQTPWPSHQKLPHTPQSPQAVLDCHKLEQWIHEQGPLTIRTPQPGDLFSPPGLQAPGRKLKKFFQEQHLPHAKRRIWPVVACGSRVLWLPGLGVCGLTKAIPETSLATCLEISAEKNS